MRTNQSQVSNLVVLYYLNEKLFTIDEELRKLYILKSPLEVIDYQANENLSPYHLGIYTTMGYTTVGRNY